MNSIPRESHSLTKFATFAVAKNLSSDMYILHLIVFHSDMNSSLLSFGRKLVKCKIGRISILMSYSFSGFFNGYYSIFYKKKHNIILNCCYFTMSGARMSKPVIPVHIKKAKIEEIIIFSSHIINPVIKNT